MYRKLIAVLFFIVTAVLLHAEKYAVIYTELPVLAEVSPSKCKFNMKDMEKAWKTTFLKWEYLICKEGIKKENICVLYCEGKDLTKYPFSYALNRRYRPENVLPDPQYSITTNEATPDELNKQISILQKKNNGNDEIMIFHYDIKENNFIKKL